MKIIIRRPPCPVPAEWERFAALHRRGGFYWLLDDGPCRSLSGWYLVFIPPDHIPGLAIWTLRVAEAHLGSDEPEPPYQWGFGGALEPCPMIGTACISIPDCNGLPPETLAEIAALGSRP